MTDREGSDGSGDGDRGSDGSGDEVLDPGGPSDPTDPFAEPDTGDDVDEDRFERMATDDEVDPFASLDEDRNVDRDESSDRDEFSDHEDSSNHEDSSDRAPVATSAASDGADDEVDPFAELDASPDPDAPPGSAEDPFERMAVDEVDMDDVWDALDDDTDLPPPAGGDGADPDTRNDDVVDKRTYCQRCPHFAEPPETACTREGTDIVEVIGFGEFRLRGCPMVSEDGPSFDRSR